MNLDAYQKASQALKDRFSSDTWKVYALYRLKAKRRRKYTPDRHRNMSERTKALLTAGRRPARTDLHSARRYPMLCMSSAPSAFFCECVLPKLEEPAGRRALAGFSSSSSCVKPLPTANAIISSAAVVGKVPPQPQKVACQEMIFVLKVCKSKYEKLAVVQDIALDKSKKFVKAMCIRRIRDCRANLNRNVYMVVRAKHDEEIIDSLRRNDSKVLQEFFAKLCILVDFKGVFSVQDIGVYSRAEEDPEIEDLLGRVSESWVQAGSEPLERESNVIVIRSSYDSLAIK